MAISMDLRVLAKKLENNSDNLLVKAASKDRKTFEKVAQAIAAASTLLEGVADDMDNNMELDLRPEQLDELAALASAFSESGDPLLQKQASVLDEILLSIASPKNASAKIKQIHEDELNRIREQRRKETSEELYHGPKKALDKMNLVNEQAKAVNEQVKSYRPLEAPLQTRYSPDMPGNPMTRIADGVYQDIITGKIYDYKQGYTTAKGNKVPGSSVEGQTRDLGDSRQQSNSLFETREGITGRYAQQDTSDGVVKTASRDEIENALLTARDTAPHLMTSALDNCFYAGLSTREVAEILARPKAEKLANEGLDLVKQTLVSEGGAELFHQLSPSSPGTVGEVGTSKDLIGVPKPGHRQTTVRPIHTVPKLEGRVELGDDEMFLGRHLKDLVLAYESATSQEEQDRLRDSINELRDQMAMMGISNHQFNHLVKMIRDRNPEFERVISAALSNGIGLLRFALNNKTAGVEEIDFGDEPVSVGLDIDVPNAPVAPKAPIIPAPVAAKPLATVPAKAQLPIPMPPIAPAQPVAPAPLEIPQDTGIEPVKGPSKGPLKPQAPYKIPEGTRRRQLPVSPDARMARVEDPALLSDKEPMTKEVLQDLKAGVIGLKEAIGRLTGYPIFLDKAEAQVLVKDYLPKPANVQADAVRICRLYENYLNKNHIDLEEAKRQLLELGISPDNVQKGLAQARQNALDEIEATYPSDSKLSKADKKKKENLLAMYSLAPEVTESTILPEEVDGLKTPVGANRDAWMTKYYESYNEAMEAGFNVDTVKGMEDLKAYIVMEMNDAGFVSPYDKNARGHTWLLVAERKASTEAPEEGPIGPGTGRGKPSSKLERFRTKYETELAQKEQMPLQEAEGIIIDAYLAKYPSEPVAAIMEKLNQKLTPDQKQVVANSAPNVLSSVIESLHSGKDIPTVIASERIPDDALHVVDDILGYEKALIEAKKATPRNLSISEWRDAINNFMVDYQPPYYPPYQPTKGHYKIKGIPGAYVKNEWDLLKKIKSRMGLAKGQNINDYPKLVEEIRNNRQFIEEVRPGMAGERVAEEVITQVGDLHTPNGKPEPWRQSVLQGIIDYLGSLDGEKADELGDALVASDEKGTDDREKLVNAVLDNNLPNEELKNRVAQFMESLGFISPWKKDPHTKLTWAQVSQQSTHNPDPNLPTRDLPMSRTHDDALRVLPDEPLLSEFSPTMKGNLKGILNNHFAGRRDDSWILGKIQHNCVAVDDFIVTEKDLKVGPGQVIKVLKNPHTSNEDVERRLQRANRPSMPREYTATHAKKEKGEKPSKESADKPPKARPGYTMSWDGEKWEERPIDMPLKVPFGQVDPKTHIRPDFGLDDWLEAFEEAKGKIVANKEEGWNYFNKIVSKGNKTPDQEKYINGYKSRINKAMNEAGFAGAFEEDHKTGKLWYVAIDDIQKDNQEHINKAKANAETIAKGKARGEAPPEFIES